MFLRLEYETLNMRECNMPFVVPFVKTIVILTMETST